MNLEDFCKKITFKYIKTNTKTSELVKDRISIEEEIVNTILPEENQNIDILKKMCSIPKMSTFATGVIINKIVSEIENDTCFLNIGVWQGFTFFSGTANNFSKNCIGVDNFSEFYPEIAKNSFYSNFSFFQGLDNIKFYEEDYEVYFDKIHKEKIGFYIYDGEHSYKNQLKGLQLAEPYFSDNCIILVDDTNIPEVKKSIIDFIAQSKNNYKILFDVNTANNCHPTFWNGLLIFQKI
ncbi:MAG: class I SAM-dependent methyltransferase [Candidatus Sericytochromatia bacterium]